MLDEILKKLSENPESIVELLEYYECGKIKVNTREVRFARDDRPESGLNISIRLTNNDACFIKDYARSEVNNLVSWLCKEKNVKFKDVLINIKRILHLSDDWRPQNRRLIFGGVYEHIIHRADSPPKTYDESILDDYLKVPNVRFQHDHILLETQMEFGISYDVNTDRIVIPIRDQHGSLMGVKGRRNYETDNGDDPKYLYLVPCQMSKTLFGYSTNYSSMYGGTVMIFESEKSVLQCASYGYHNAVALGSNSLSEYQAKMILSLNPQKVIFMLDSDLPLDNTKRNIDMLRSVATMRDLQISYFDWTECLDLPAKASASDEGKEVLQYILAENIKDETELEDEL
jgi:hypothetical protein